MQTNDPTNFDIDVDISPFLGTMAGPSLVSSRWYELAAPRQGRPDALQRKVDQTFRNAMLWAQWTAIPKRSRDRRRAVRAPVLSRVRVERGPDLTACNVSMAGMRCVGRLVSGMLDLEFNLPGEPFPVSARAEVTHYAPTNVVPRVGLRFVNIEPVYVQQIARYVDRRLSRRSK